MASPHPPLSDQKDVESSVDLTESAPTTFQNGTAPITMLRVTQLMTRENIGWTLVALVAMDYFQITNQVIGLVSNVC